MLLLVYFVASRKTTTKRKKDKTSHLTNVPQNKEEQKVKSYEFLGAPWIVIRESGSPLWRRRVLTSCYVSYNLRKYQSVSITQHDLFG